MAKRRKRKYSRIPSILAGAIFIYFLFKIIFSFLPVEVVQASTSQLEDTLMGEFLVLRKETVITSPYKGYFVKAKDEGERVAKDTVIGYLEVIEGTSLEKSRSIPIKAPVAGLVSYKADGLESLCNPDLWRQLDLDRLDILPTLELNAEKINDDEDSNKGQGNRLMESGGAICKIVDNLDCFYFYLRGEGAYPERIKKGSNVQIRLNSNEELLLQGNVVNISRNTGEYEMLIKFADAVDYNFKRKEIGQIILGSYKGIVLPEKVLVEKEGKLGVYLFKNGRAVWQQVEKIAQLQMKVVLSGLNEGDWVIMNPQLVTEGKRVTRLSK